MSIKTINFNSFIINYPTTSLPNYFLPIFFVGTVHAYFTCEFLLSSHIFNTIVNFFIGSNYK